MSRHLWLLEVSPSSGGMVLRYCTERVEVEAADGTVYTYRAGLEDLELGIGDDPVDVSWVDEALDTVVIGPTLDGARVVLRRWEDGALLERSEVFAIGVAIDVSYGEPSEPIELTIGSLVTVLLRMPDPERVVSLTTAP